METQTKKYSWFRYGSLQELSRVTLKDNMGLTGTEISINRLPAGQSIPFVHAHKKNEEVYIFVCGKGSFWIDGDVIEVAEGSAVKITPAAGRCLKADDKEDLCYFCIQAQENSLTQHTREDGVILDVKVPWQP